MKNYSIEEVREYFSRVKYAADNQRSKLHRNHSNIYSANGAGTYHALNILCEKSYPISYLDVGIYFGASLTAAMWENKVNAIGVDEYKFVGNAARTTLDHNLNLFSRFFENAKSDIMVTNILDLNITNVYDVVFYDIGFDLQEIDKFVDAFKGKIKKYSVIAFANPKYPENVDAVREILRKHKFFIMNRLYLPKTGISNHGKTSLCMFYIINENLK